VSPFFLIALTTLAIIPARSAELEAIEFGGGYRVRVTGTISDDTAAALIELMRGRGRFPDALLLSADTGDAAAGMELGRFARAVMLPVSAGASCGDACILAWAGGIARSTRSPLRLDETTAGDATVADYLADMDAPPPEIHSASRVPAEHEAWLAERCGSLTDKQQSDLAAIRALRAMEASLDAMSMGGMGSQSSYTVDAQTQRDAARARELSADERATVVSAQTEIDGCSASAIARVRASLVE